MTIFGRITARQRLRRATRESLTIPAFSSHVDCSPWVTGGLWPAELSTASAETTALAAYLKSDLQRITDGANDELTAIKRAVMPGPARQAEEARVIDAARARAALRVESTIRHLRAVKPEAPVERPRPRQDENERENDRDDAPVGRDPADVRAPDDANAEEPTAAPPPEAMEPAVAGESDDERLRRILAFVVHQEPRLNWAVGDRPDGTAVLVTDLAHGWIPPGITLPAGVRLLEPGRRTGKVFAMVGESRRTVTYAPGDSLGRLDDFAETKASVQPRELPPIQDLGWELSQTTHWRDGLPRMVHTLARAAASGTGVAEEEIDLLRVHLDTARYQLLAQHPNVDPALLLNCLLLAATEGAVTGDAISANYHLAWFRKLSAPADCP